MAPARWQCKRFMSCRLTLSMMFSFLWGCSRSGQERIQATAVAEKGRAEASTSSAENVGVKHYVLKGEVRKVDKEAREVTIHHEEIPGFMVAMTMPFRLDDEALLGELKPGDGVEGK